MIEERSFTTAYSQLCLQSVGNNFTVDNLIVKMVTSPRQLPYAPTPHSYVPNSAMSATINLDEVAV
jgi:hypothetical protein